MAAQRGTASDKPNERPSRRELLTVAGTAGADRLVPSIGGALAATAIASSPEGIDVEKLLDRTGCCPHDTETGALFDAVARALGAVTP
jgi:hypothetical protein